MIDNDYWENRETFSISEAAKLLYDIDPLSKEEIPDGLKEKISEMEVILKKRAKAMDKEASLNDPYYHFNFNMLKRMYLDYSFGRKDLTKIAEKYKLHPLFLYPEDGSLPAKNKKSGNRAKETPISKSELDTKETESHSPNIPDTSQVKEVTTINGRLDKPDDITAKQESFDCFLKKLTVSYVTDESVSVQIVGKKPINYRYVHLGFRNPGKQWKAFIEILRDPDHIYALPKSQTDELLGKPVKNPDYEKRIGLLKEIIKKLINFFNKEFNVNIPSNYNLLEKTPATKTRTRKFKFNIGDEKYSFDGFSKEQILVEIRKLTKDENAPAEKLKAATDHAKSLGIKENDLLDSLPYEPKEDIRYDPHENEKLESEY